MAEWMFGVSLTTDKAIYAAGESIVMELIVFNRTAESLTFEFGNAQHYDFIIGDAGGNSVWRWAEGRMFAQVLGEETLGPGREEVLYTETHTGLIQPGSYKVTGALVSYNWPLSASLTITIEYRGRDRHVASLRPKGHRRVRSAGPGRRNQRGYNTCPEEDARGCHE